jgi:hypothetical protein
VRVDERKGEVGTRGRAAGGGARRTRERVPTRRVAVEHVRVDAR